MPGECLLQSYCKRTLTAPMKLTVHTRQKIEHHAVYLSPRQREDSVDVVVRTCVAVGVGVGVIDQTIAVLARALVESQEVVDAAVETAPRDWLSELAACANTSHESVQRNSDMTCQWAADSSS